MLSEPASVIEQIKRFNRTERALHWTHATSFLLLLFTGCFLYFPVLNEFTGTIGIPHLMVLNAHVAVGAFYVGGPLLWWLFGDRGALRGDLHELDVWDNDDKRFLASPLASLGGGEPIPQGRFNAGQKLNTILLGAAILGFGTTGLIMWQQDTHIFPSWMVQGSVNMHDILTILTAALVAGHIYLAALHPTTRPSLSGMVSGYVPLAWARHHHAKWVDKTLAQDDEAQPSRDANS